MQGDSLRFGQFGMCRYIGLDILAKSRITATTASTTEEVTLTAITA